MICYENSYFLKNMLEICAKTTKNDLEPFSKNPNNKKAWNLDIISVLGCISKYNMWFSM